MNNIDAFDVTAATILAKLYKSFPKKLILECDSFCNELDIKGYDKEQKIELCKDTMTFLQENGFIQSNSPSNSTAWAYVSLTMQGLTALKSEPKILKEDESIGKRLIRAIESGSTDMAIHMAQNALMALFK